MNDHHPSVKVFRTHGYCMYTCAYVCAILHAAANVYYFNLYVVHGLCVLLHGFHVAESYTFSVNTYQPRL